MRVHTYHTLAHKCHLFSHTHVHTATHSHTHTHLHAHIRTHAQSHTQQTRANTHTRTRAYTYTRAYVRARTHAHTRSHAHTNALIQVHTHKRAYVPTLICTFKCICFCLRFRIQQNRVIESAECFSRIQADKNEK